MRRTAAVLATLVALVGWGALQSFAPAARAGVGVLGTGISPSQELAIDNETDCLEAAPDGMSVSGVSDDGANIAVDVLVLLDGVTQAEGKDVFARAQKSYTPLGITVRPTFQTMSFPEDAVEATEIIELTMSRFGGQRPAGSDIVHVLTLKDIADAGNTAVVGMADCIGGVKDGAHAFSVSEGIGTPAFHLGPIGMDVEQAARVAAHELGHLLGAHHHYANCVEGALNAAASIEAATCTLMFNVVNLAVTNFSAVNGTVVRAHAVDYARP